MNIFQPSILLAICLGLVASFSTIQWRTVEVRFANYRATVLQQEAVNTKVALEHTQELQRLQARHATRQQELIGAYHAAQTKLAVARSQRAAFDAGLRQHAATFVTEHTSPTSSDSPACRLAREQLAAATDLLLEGSDLAGEGLGLLQERTAEVSFWRDLAINDRGLLSDAQRDQITNQRHHDSTPTP